MPEFFEILFSSEMNNDKNGFAIACHLNLLTEIREKIKMDDTIKYFAADVLVLLFDSQY